MIDQRSWRRSETKESRGRALFSKVIQNWTKVEKTFKA